VTLIIPTFCAHQVADWSKLLVEISDGRKYLNIATATLINYMPIIGIIELTEANIDDAWVRIMLIENLFLKCIVDNNGRRVFLTKDDVARHVGLSTEGASLTFHEFYEKWCNCRLALPLTDTASFIANGDMTALCKAGAVNNAA